HRSIIMAYTFAIALFLVGELISAGFDQPNHILTILVISSFVGYVGIGQTLVILTGGIDLSIAYLMNATAVFMTGLAASHIAPTDVVLVIVAFGGALVGFVNGIGIVIFNIPPLVMTLGMNSVLEGVVLVYTNGTPAGNAPALIHYLVNGRIGPLPVDLVVWAVLAIVVGVMLARTVFGRRLYAVGNSITSSYLSGINVGRTLMGTYTIAGFFTGLAGMFLAGFAGYSYLGMGDAYLLPSIAVVVIGGASIVGGRGNYVGTIAGAIIITVLTTILTILNMPIAVRDILYGLVILAALLLYSRGRSTQ
ncbi:MAG: ABC transporter permease, partial [Firmicutes bacterium]|nr:ABC transporter permease [Bacillota bacterium]